MKTKKTIIACVMALFTINSFAQKNFYVKFNTGYNFGIASFTGVNSNSTDNVTSYEKVNISPGKGISFGGSVSYMFNKNIGVDLGVNYLLNGTSTETDKSTSSFSGTNASSTISYSTTLLNLIPSVIITPGFEKINPYARFGFSVGMASMTVKDESSITSGGITNTATKAELYNGSYALGLVSAIGTTYYINDNLSVFGEINLSALTYSPSKSEVTESTFDGVNKLSDLKTIDKKTEYFESYSRDNSIAPDENAPRKSLKSALPFSSIGLNIGVMYRF